MTKIITEFTTDDFNSPLHVELYTYWLKKKGDRIMPARSDINPVDLPNLLPYVMLLDVEKSPLRFRIRLAGSEIVNIGGMKLTGSWVDEGPHTENIIQRSTWIVENKRPYYTIDVVAWASKDYKNYTALALPLSSDGKNVDMILSSNYFY